MARHRGIHQLSSVLSMWNSSGSAVGLLGTFEREGPLGWNHLRFFRAGSSSASCDHLHRLGETGVCCAPSLARTFQLLPLDLKIS